MDKYQTLYENSPDMHVSVSAEDARIMDCNRTLATKTGYAKEEIIGQSFFSLFDPGCRSEVERALKSLEENGRVENAELELRKNDGSTATVLLNVEAIRDSKGRVVFGNSVLRDIAESERLRRRLADALKRTQEAEAVAHDGALKLRGIFDNSRSFIGLADTDGTLIDANKTALSAAGIEADEVLGKRFWETIWWSHSETQQKRLKEAFAKAAQGEPDGFEATHPIDDMGTVIYVDFTVSPIFGNDGVVKFIVPEGRDITVQKRQETAIVSKNKQLRRLNEELLQFAYSASHDLKAPLATMSGLLSICESDLESGDLEEVRKNVTYSRTLADRLAEKIENTLAIAKTESAALEWEEVRVEELIVETWAMLNPTDVQLSLDLSHDEPFRGVRLRLSVILENLLSNAIKYRRAGVQHRVQVRSASEKGNFSLSIEDNGCGIPQAQIEHVFKLFHRASSSEEGTGIGLALVKKNVIHLGGEIGVESSDGKTIFTMVLPQNGNDSE